MSSRLFSLLLSAAVFFAVCTIAQDTSLVSERVWMLDGIAVESGDLARNTAIKSQVGRTHPVGKLFLECKKDGSFAMLRGDETAHQGKWTFANGTLELQRVSSTGSPIEQPLKYSVVSADTTRLVLRVAFPAGMPEVRLEFSPGQWPQR